MPKPDLKDLSTANEIDLTVKGRKSGQEISRPVWFVHEDDKLYLLPVQGSDTNWYRNVLKNQRQNCGTRTRVERRSKNDHR
jgi:hypothetical protein